MYVFLCDVDVCVLLFVLYLLAVCISDIKGAGCVGEGVWFEALWG